jgi:hypothetical protein
MSLATYDEARPWAKAIRDEVLNRRMPPWGAIKGFGDFANDISLSQDEINRLAEWVEGGAPEGEALYLQPAPTPENTAAAITGKRVRKFTGGTLIGIKPLADTDDAKITAHYPDGRIEPLLWLRNYKAQWARTFIYRDPLHLPSGVRIVSEPEVPLEFVIKSPRQGR